MKIKLQVNILPRMQLKDIFLIFVFIYSHTNLFGQANKLLFKDDFSQNTMGVNWRPDLFWSIGNGVAYNNYDFSTLLSLRRFSAPSYVIETTVKGFSYAYGRQFHFTFGQANDTANQAYVVSYFPGTAGLLTLGRATDNIFYPTTLDQTVIYPAFEANRWQKFKIIKYKSGLIQVYLDKGAGYSSLPLLETIDSTYQQLGHFGWTVSTQTAPLTFTVDQVEARTPAIEKPAVREKPVEDNLISQVIATNNKPYPITKLQTGTKLYSDRDYTITALPAYLQGASFIQTANNEKHNTQADFLAVFLKKSVVAYVAYDSRATALPAWLADWEKTNDSITTSDSGTNYFKIYSKVLENGGYIPRLFLFGGNLASPATGAKTNYLVAVVEEPAFKILEAEKAKVIGAKIANNHTGYSGTGFVDFIHKEGDYIEWTTQTQIPGTHVLSFVFSNASKAERFLAVTVDGKDAGIHSFIPITSWDSWASYSAPQVYLTSGQHKIRVTAIGTSGPNLDCVSLSYMSASRQEQLAGRYAKKSPAQPKFFPSEVKALAYPNPFTNKATITYSLPEQAAVYLTVYNQQGHQVAVLVNQVQPAGNYNALFNGASLPKGLYLYRLQVGVKALESGKLWKQ
ncbi:T9SS type A sorting domain-containing protein [Adhaeribacter pallidiroseus]|uniref:Dextranase n=1 Tax=Adhaeribacter pallidiroseus TaxID=2072847 RepID=A0A369QPU9_9BACT|nr:T9SS type A sorting domain-containing protein [Adhaeribacter pallidiroseus]RDC65695.1 Dextranase [Adhaeribacter pallidiroseus]